MKYWFITYNFLDGEHEYASRGLIEMYEGDNRDAIKEFEKVHLSDMWGDATIHEDDAYWSPTQEVCVSVQSCREISKRDFNVLAKYILAHRYISEPEKVSFT